MESIAIQYIRSYGERGSSTGQFEYPRGITPVGASVCDTQNNRIVSTDLISTFLEKGVGVLSFPDSIYYGSNVYYVSDSENRIALPFGIYYIGTRGVEMEFDSQRYCY